MHPKRLIVLVNLLLLLFIVWLMLSATQTADIVSELRDRSGRWASYLLLATLLFTPITHYRPSLRRYLPLRRHLGLWAFALLMIHLLVWIVLEFAFDWLLMWQEIDSNLFIWLGLLSSLLLLPLAFTSSHWAMRKLGYRKWQGWHSLTYLAVPLALGHYFMAQKVIEIEPLILIIVVVLVLVWRFKYAR